MQVEHRKAFTIQGHPLPMPLQLGEGNPARRGQRIDPELVVDTDGVQVVTFERVGLAGKLPRRPVRQPRQGEHPAPGILRVRRHGDVDVIRYAHIAVGGQGIARDQEVAHPLAVEQARRMNHILPVAGRVKTVPAGSAAAPLSPGARVKQSPQPARHTSAPSPHSLGPWFGTESPPWGPGSADWQWLAPRRAPAASAGAGAPGGRGWWGPMMVGTAPSDGHQSPECSIAPPRDAGAGVPVS